MQVKSLKYPLTAHKATAISNLPAIDQKYQIRKIFHQQNNKN
jgi:hypothetical protein